MSEAAFPILGTVFVLLVLLPICALVVKLGLLLIERYETSGLLRRLHLRYLFLTGSSALPLAWLVSAGLHQVESGKSALSCLLDHDTSALCLEPGFFALALALVATITSLPLLFKHKFPPASTTKVAEQLISRIRHIIAAHPELTLLSNRIIVSDDSTLSIYTHGVFRPRVVISTHYAARLSDPMLRSALGHELEHVRSYDPLRYLFLHAALSVNPFGRFLLAPHAKSWQFAREAQCDRQAVINGAAPLSLAEAILQAARPSARELVALGTGDLTAVKFRVNMLLSFAEHPPERNTRNHRSIVALLPFILTVLALLLPHQTSTSALDTLHLGAEHALSNFLR